MPNRQKMQHSARPSAAKKSAATAPIAADAARKKTATAAAKSDVVPKNAAAAKALKPKPSRPAPATKELDVISSAKPAKASPEIGKRLKPVKHAENDKAVKPVKEVRQKHKLVRDSFTLPREDFELIHVLKERALGFKRPTKKSELLRAGLQALAKLDAAELQQRLDALITLSPGRPKKHR